MCCLSPSVRVMPGQHQGLWEVVARAGLWAWLGYPKGGTETSVDSSEAYAEADTLVLIPTFA